VRPKPTSKTGLIRWAKGNVGTTIRVRMIASFVTEDGTILKQKCIWDDVRPISKVQSNAIVFADKSYLFTDQIGDSWEFTETGFSPGPRSFYKGQVKSFKDKELEGINPETKIFLREQLYYTYEGV
jgi:hypothetical protein